MTFPGTYIWDRIAHARASGVLREWITMTLAKYSKRPGKVWPRPLKWTPTGGHEDGDAALAKARGGMRNLYHGLVATAPPRGKLNSITFEAKAAKKKGEKARIEEGGKVPTEVEKEDKNADQENGGKAPNEAEAVHNKRVGR